MGVPWRTRPTWLISHQLWCSPAGGEKKETGGRRRWYSVFVPSVKTWKTNNVTMHKSLRRPLLTQVGTQISTSTLQRKLIFSPALCSSIMREKELTQPPPIHQRMLSGDTPFLLDDNSFLVVHAPMNGWWSNHWCGSSLLATWYVYCQLPIRNPLFSGHNLEQIVQHHLWPHGFPLFSY